MQDFGGLEFGAPSEGGTSASEQLSEEAKQRFAAAQAQIKQIIREEKKARKRDDRIVETIKQFLQDEKYAHLFQLISRLSARDCPSVFIVAILSLIHDGCLQSIEEFIAERKLIIQLPDEQTLTKKNQGLPPGMQVDLLLWTTRIELVLSTDALKILTKIMVDESTIDGSVLQLTTFVLIEYFESKKREVSYEEIQPIAIKILQDLLHEHMEEMEKYFASRQVNKEVDE